MPEKKKPGIARLNLRCEPWFADLVAATAARQGGRSVSSYMREALTDKMKADGVDVPDDLPEVKPRGRPRR